MVYGICPFIPGVTGCDQSFSCLDPSECLRGIEEEESIREVDQYLEMMALSPEGF